MSIFTKDSLKEKVEAMDLDTAKTVLKKIIDFPMAESTYGRIARAVMKLDQSVKEKKIVKISKGRTVPYKTLEALTTSPMINYVDELIMAATDPRGPYQSREIMMLAAQIKGGDVPFITSKGIPQQYKNQAGHILTLAGFERVSHYDRERKMPVKAWKSMHGFKSLTNEQRAIEVMATLNMELDQTEEVLQAPVQKYSLLGSFL